MTRTFSASVNEWVRESKARLDAVFKESAQDVIAEMQAVGPSVANPDSFGTGNMPVDTGFLRASLRASLDQPASAVVPRPSGDATHTYDAGEVALVINNAKAGQVIYATYTADYAPAMEDRYAFVRLAAQNWQQIVTRRAKEIRNRVRARK